MPVVKTSHNIAIMPERSRVNSPSDWKGATQASSRIIWCLRSWTSDIRSTTARWDDRVFFPLLHPSILFSGFCHSFPICKITSDFGWNPTFSHLPRHLSLSFTHLHFPSILPLSPSIPPPICSPLCAPPSPLLSIHLLLSFYFSLFLLFPLVAS